jgi:hypothetical protein
MDFGHLGTQGIWYERADYRLEKMELPLPEVGDVLQSLVHGVQRILGADDVLQFFGKARFRFRLKLPPTGTLVHFFPPIGYRASGIGSCQRAVARPAKLLTATLITIVIQAWVHCFRSPDAGEKINARKLVADGCSKENNDPLNDLTT